MELAVYHARQETADAPGKPPNPYRQVFVPGPTIQDGLSMLPVEDVMEYCRHEHWRRRFPMEPYGRWWLSKHVAIGMRELERRGIPMHAWRDGTEEDATEDGG